MKHVLILFFFLFHLIFYSQSVIGKWKTIDDTTGKAKSIVQIYEQEGKIYGKIVEILEPRNKDKVCEKCLGDLKDKPVLGLVVMRELVKDGEEYSGGKILDPESGKEYKCYITLEGENRLKVRGYIGFSLMGRTQIWERI